MENKRTENSVIIRSGKGSTSGAGVVRAGAEGRKLKPSRSFNYYKKKSEPFPFSFVAGVVILTALLLFLMMSYAEVDRYNGAIGELKSQITDLQKEADKLEQRLDRRDDLVKIEEYASEQLGMVKSTDLQRISVTLIGKDDSSIYRYDDGTEGGIGALLSGFGRVIRNFFN